MFMRTDRLFLRPTFAEDWRDLYRGINDAGVVRMLAQAPWPYTMDHAREFCALPQEPFNLRLAITLPGIDGAQLIGGIGMDCNQTAPELGYWIARGYRRQGYATEAVRGIVEMARAIGVKRVEAAHYLDNPASGMVLKKGGFVETGEVRPTHALGRGGQLVLARRYALNLAENDDEGDMGCCPEDNRKPA